MAICYLNDIWTFITVVFLEIFANIKMLHVANIVVSQYLPFYRSTLLWKQCSAGTQKQDYTWPETHPIDLLTQFIFYNWNQNKRLNATCGQHSSQKTGLSVVDVSITWFIALFFFMLHLLLSMICGARREFIINSLMRSSDLRVFSLSIVQVQKVIHNQWDLLLFRFLLNSIRKRKQMILWVAK